MKRTMSVILVLIFTTLAFSSCDDYTTRIDDIEMFINETYYSDDYVEGDDYWKYPEGRNAHDFFPSYDEIEYAYSDINFYVYACSDFFDYPDTTIVLELKFDNAQAYNNAKQDIYSTYTFLQNSVEDDMWLSLTVMPQAEFTIGNYKVKIITQGEENDFPHNVYAICENQSEWVIRYLYVYDLDQDALDEDDFIDGIIDNSNCDW